ncbi:hypothetical protein [Myxococcus sp. RHSTA-1-4]|uniref:hypothetical protein n=1 Tax=Myxococcus sp. RHSTA-1-4 TaxID=2874601 RepID=UPI001CBE7405|nr:hypothetical protein [Myxococcus sp. RHSTA-1-4]MBZ4421758.1 hypothetical protein [Myxococcus sp. RHSTA-1-4]
MAPPFLLTACLTLVGLGSMWGVVMNRQDAADRQRLEDAVSMSSAPSSSMLDSVFSGLAEAV